MKDHARQLLEKYIGKPFLDPRQARYGDAGSRMQAADVEAGLAWLDDRFHLIRYEDDELPSVDWVLDLARAAVLRCALVHSSRVPRMSFVKGHEGQDTTVQHHARVIVLGRTPYTNTQLCLLSREDNAKALLRRMLQKAQTVRVCLRLGALCYGHPFHGAGTASGG